MELKAGYKLTEIGVIPDDWGVERIADLGSVVRGGSPRPAGDPRYFNGSYIPWLTVAALTNVPDYQLMITETVGYLTEEGSKHSRTLDKGTLIISNSGATLGVAKILDIKCCANDGIAAIIGQKRGDRAFLCYYIDTRTDNLRQVIATGNGQPNLNTGLIKEILVPFPDEDEQRAIAAALSDVDALLEALERLIAKKRDLKQAVMQQLLAGETRLPGFTAEWEEKCIGEIAIPQSEKNTVGESLPVLACSKHQGFVDSLAFFKNQVFSNDLSSYKLVRRGEIAYPANHVEEGSIGLQDLYEVALVSPIYVVFKVMEHINSFFLHRLLKLDSFRQKFKMATTSSVDRRGSLRWPAFSEISVWVPPTLSEQNAIANVLSDVEKEIALLEKRIAKTRDIKKAMMLELLTGSTRLVTSEVVHA